MVWPLDLQRCIRTVTIAQGTQQRRASQVAYSREERWACFPESGQKKGRHLAAPLAQQLFHEHSRQSLLDDVSCLRQGIGTERRLTVSAGAFIDGSAGKEISSKAHELYDLCQREDPSFWGWGLRELDELLQSERPLPPELQGLLQPLPTR